MKVTTFEGIVENGQIRLPAGVRLPEKAKVYIVVPGIDTRPVAYVGSPRLAQEDFKKEVVGENQDASL